MSEEYFHAQLDKLDRVILALHLGDLERRRVIRQNAKAILGAVGTFRTLSPAVRGRIRARAYEILRDVGVELSDDDPYARLTSLAEGTTKIYLDLRDGVGLGRALINLSIVHRLTDDLPQARQAIGAAVTILDAAHRRNTSDQGLATTFQRALVYYARENRSERSMRQAEDLTAKIDDPAAAAFMRRERIGHLSRTGRLDEAQAAIGDARVLHERLAESARTSMLTVPLLRAELELLLIRRRRDEAAALIKEQYVPIQRQVRLGSPTTRRFEEVSWELCPGFSLDGQFISSLIEIPRYGISFPRPRSAA